ncbi:hypothetical protein CERZMDRAFT_91096 [Cercospora zeae-maydis SCOH1-5]|uniref:Uncharacterized protein n=1 Tax=Cercospora zeae-maydis SCOH1-5 TaxID=717836 RepID=A0A6A6FB63_9PEZI|nr:hypothetical protein CERZMDRAFT_91096 [Cercospora zeae-maydis SCOH1-5]
MHAQVGKTQDKLPPFAKKAKASKRLCRCLIISSSKLYGILQITPASAHGESSKQQP